MSLTPGTHLGSYEIISLLGSGGMGEVYRAKDLKLERDVAIKVLREELASDPERLRRFEQEARAASALNHPNIITIHDIGQHGSTSYIAMEYVEGKTVRQIFSEGSLPAKKLLQLATQIAEGLAKAHSAGIVHRDLKPENLMVTNDGFVKILDFGLAKLLAPVGKGSSELATLAKEGTEPGVVMGTVGYMSPEQAGGRPVDFRSDQFSLGAILYEMTTGKRAFQRETAAETLTAIIREETEPITEINPELPPPLRWIIERCLEKKPEDRYGTTQDLARELQNVREHLAEVSSGPSAAASPRRTSKPLWLAAAAVVALVALGVAAYFFTETRGPELVTNRVAVAIFENQTGDPTLDPVGRMAADWITQGLAHTGMVDVVPSNSVLSLMKYLEEDAGTLQGEALMKAIARETQASTIISGTYYKLGESIQFQAQGTDIEDEKVLFALDPVEGPLDKPAETIETLRQRVMGAMAIQFDPKFASSEMRNPPSFAVYQLYSKGMDLFRDGDFGGAIDEFNKIAEIDPSYLAPLVDAAIAHTNMEDYATAESLILRLLDSREDLTPLNILILEQTLSEARGNLVDSLHKMKQAAELNPRHNMHYDVGMYALALNRLDEALEFFSLVDRESYFAKGWPWFWNYLTVTRHLLGQYEQELETARQRRRHFPESLPWDEVRALAAMGRVEEVQRLFDESLRLPQSSTGSPGGVMEVATLELRTHGYTETVPQILDNAIRWYKSRPPGEAENERLRYGFARVLYLAERWEEAKSVLKELASEFPDNLDYQGYLGALAAKRGETEEALRIPERLRGLDRGYLHGQHIYWQACISAQLGEQEAAVDLLREAFSQGLWYSIDFHRDVNLEALRDYAPFQELMRPK